MSGLTTPSPRIQSERMTVGRVLAALMAGLIVSIMPLVVAISMATLIFSGDLAPYVAGGLAAMLIAIVALALVVAAAGSLPFAVAGAQDTTAVILAVAAASISSTLTSQGLARQVYPTVMAFIVLSSILLGIVFVALGTLRLGRLIRFIPYPVIGGFLAGTGWLLTIGGIGMMAGISVAPGNLGSLFAADTMAHWLPGAALAVLLLVLTTRVKSSFVLPATLLMSVALFYAVLWLTQVSPAQAGAQGWLLGPFAQGFRWPPLMPAQWVDISLPALARETPTMISLLLLGAISLLLNETGLELALHRDLRLDKDLRANGWANVVSGLLGGAPGYTFISISLIGPRMRIQSRIVPLTVALVGASMLVVGAQSLTYFPRFALGGLILYVGIGLLIEWVYATWFSLPRLDWALLMLIVAVIAAVGLLPGIAIGLLVAMGLFVVRYSRVGVIRNILNGQTFTSNRQRSLEQERMLRQYGAELYIVRLQNYLFFGTANSLLEQIRQRMDDTAQPPVRFIVLDFRRVVGIDSSAVLSFARLQQITASHDITLVLAQVGDAVLHELKIRPGSEDANVKVFSELNHGVEWCEDQILVAHGGQAEHELPLTGELARFVPYMERHEIAAGEAIVRQGAAADEVYLIAAGHATVTLALPDGAELRLRTMDAGVWVGEIGFYLNIPRTASVVADEPMIVYGLSRAGLERMLTEEPALAAGFHEMVAREMAERSTNTDRAMVGLLA